MLNVPATQGVQIELPPVLKVPAGQAWHAEESEAPRTSLNAPAGQELHTVVPAALQEPRGQQIPAPGPLNFPWSKRAGVEGAG